MFERIYEEINLNGEMAFCYFSLWAPGRMAKLQSDISGMISPRHFRRFVLPFIREQCQRLDYSMYHLDGVDAMRHLDMLLEIEELNAIQWTPRRGPAAGRRPVLVRPVPAHPRGGQVGHGQLGGSERASAAARRGRPGGNRTSCMHLESERDIDAALEIAARLPVSCS